MIRKIHRVGRLAYKYGIALFNSLIVFLRSTAYVPIASWIRFWTPGIAYHKQIFINPFSFTVHSQSISQRVADLFMILTCVVDRQYNPPGFEIQKDDIVIDIGGHIGSFSLLAAAYAPEGHVYTFEPDPNNGMLLQKNSAANKLKNISIEQVAVSGTTGQRNFYVNSLNTAESGLYGLQTKRASIPIHSITLLDIFQRYNITCCNFLKLDCEGAEYEILFGTPASYLKKIEKIAMECHNPSYFNIPNMQYNQESMKKFLRSNGFAVTEVKENAMHSLLFARRDTSNQKI
ncbi:MAG: FkbM family methyltransferase [Parcubacteria group bacterium Gr01-1014_29]|nr:MAG: FkbM family methyltransferase [Parcubacteria group bacterium Gr01-1014_29]